ncbi:MAG: 50S ribosomal protein L35 [Acidimicrobiales bacterium]
MPKQKSHSGAKKRFKLTGSGKLMRKQRNKNHFLEKKTPKRKRQLRQEAVVAKSDEKRIKQQLSS